MPHADSSTATSTQTAVDNDVEQMPPFNVVLLNDDDHSYEYVIEMLGQLFRMPAERAMQVAKTVDAQGRAIVMTTHKELAELKRDQVHAFGRDPRIMSCAGSMSAEIEPAIAGGDDTDEGLGEDGRR
ncbi:MAG: ATP-dependent Clp protease adaptor ClpS [Phycisphaerales bacterium]|jgi:ATP-dependent Clp protease adaptor protein ClpS